MLVSVKRCPASPRRATFAPSSDREAEENVRGDWQPIKVDPGSAKLIEEGVYPEAGICETSRLGAGSRPGLRGQASAAAYEAYRTLLTSAETYTGALHLAKTPPSYGDPDSWIRIISDYFEMSRDFMFSMALAINSQKKPQKSTSRMVATVKSFWSKPPGHHHQRASGIPRG